MTDEEVEEMEPDNEGWTKVHKKDGKQGLVPTSYLTGQSEIGLTNRKPSRKITGLIEIFLIMGSFSIPKHL